MRHPLLALEKVASVTREMVVVETLVDLLDVRVPAMAFYPDKFHKDATNWVGPNPAGVVAMLKVAGFARVEIVSGLRSVFFRLARAAYYGYKRRQPFWQFARRSHRCARMEVNSRPAPPASPRAFFVSVAVFGVVACAVIGVLFQGILQTPIDTDEALYLNTGTAVERWLAADVADLMPRTRVRSPWRLWRRSWGASRDCWPVCLLAGRISFQPEAPIRSRRRSCPRPNCCLRPACRW